MLFSVCLLVFCNKRECSGSIWIWMEIKTVILQLASYLDEYMWRSSAKKKLKAMKGCHRHQLASYLDEYMWRERYGKQRNQAFINILSDIADQYPVP